MTPPGRQPLAAALTLLGLPALVAAAQAGAFYRHNASTGHMMSSGEARSYVLYVPQRYDPATPTPLVVSLHGAGLWGALQRDISGWNRIADERGILVLYPSAERDAFIWREDRGPGVWRDVHFIGDLIDTVRVHYNVDPTRVYADGLSNGGGMAFALSCTMHDRIAAVGMVASAQLLPFDWCPDTRPKPVIAFHGTRDPIVPYHGGESWIARDVFPDVPAFLGQWARRNECGDAADARIASDVVRRGWSGCSDRADVVLYAIVGGGHTWPGGLKLPAWGVGATSTSIDATRVIWAFFQAHPLARPQASP
jgi:polyhydroxybutyrate depolymerase